MCQGMPHYPCFSRLPELFFSRLGEPFFSTPEDPEDLSGPSFLLSRYIANRWCCLMVFLFMSIGILGRSSESQSQWCFCFLIRWIVQFISKDVCSRDMFASVESEVLCTSQNKDPV